MVIRCSLPTLLIYHCSLEEGGQTALGPALLVAIMMASKVRASKVVMCTDGLANVGLGNLDSDSPDQHSEASSFYSQLGEKAKENGFVVLMYLVINANVFFTQKCGQICPSCRWIQRQYVFGLSVHMCMLKWRHSRTGLSSTSSFHWF